MDAARVAHRQLERKGAGWEPAPIMSQKEEKMKKGILTGAVLAMSVAVSGCFEKPKEYTDAEKAKVCQAYIATGFGRDADQYKLNRIEQGIVYLRYTREFDNTEWDTACQISSKKQTIIWSGYLNDVQRWGRWREEDRTKLSFDQETGEVSFHEKTMDMDVVVQL